MTDIGIHPQRLDLYVHAGDPIDVAVPVLDATGATLPLLGWSATATATTPAGQLLVDFAPTIIADRIRVAAAPAQTATWQWPVFAARLLVTATPPSGQPANITLGWLRLYRR